MLEEISYRRQLKPLCAVGHWLLTQKTNLHIRVAQQDLSKLTASLMPVNSVKFQQSPVMYKT